MEALGRQLEDINSGRSQCPSLVYLDLGRQLLHKGEHDRAMAMFDMSFNQLHTAGGMQSTCLEHKLPNSLDILDEESSHNLDTYLEGERDVGPRRFTEAIVPNNAHEPSCLQFAIWYNKALVHHAKEEITEALHLYNVITGAVTVGLANNSLSQAVYRIAMRVYNNIGEIKYIQGSRDVSLIHFDTATFFVKRLQQCSATDLLDCADILSNWCRVHFLTGNMMHPELSATLEEVLRLRSSVLRWDHDDVASAHFNLGVVKYSQHQKQQALTHIMKYVTISAYRFKEGGKHRLDPIPGLIYVLLIRNEDKNDALAQDLASGLRALQVQRRRIRRNDSQTVSTLNLVGTLLFRQKDLDHALLFFQEELDLEEKLLGDGEDVSISVTCNNVGRCLQEVGRFHQAIHYYRRSLWPKFGDLIEQFDATSEKTDASILDLEKYCDQQSESPTTMNLYSTVWYNLGLIYDKMGNHIDAIKAFQVSLRLRQAMLGHDHGDVACLLYNIGVLQMEQGLLSGATKSLGEALRIRKLASRGQLNDQHLVKTLQKLASLHKSKRNFKAAMDACLEVLDILKSSQDFDQVSKHSSLGFILADIAELHQLQGNLASALDFSLDSVRSFKMARSNKAPNATEQFASLEQEISTLLLIGSLYHEICDPIAALVAFNEAVSLINEASCSPVFFEKAPSLLGFFEISYMLATTHCAPEA